MGKIIAALTVIPFAILVDWFSFIHKLPAVQQELTKASHGVFMIVAAIVLLVGRLDSGWGLRLPLEYQSYIVPALLFVITFGLFWAVVGAVRTRYYRDYHIIGRAVGKVALGIVLFIFATSWPRTYNWQLWLVYAALVVVAWCLITGATKIILMLRPLPQLSAGGVNPMPHGDSDFSDGDGLQ